MTAGASGRPQRDGRRAATGVGGEERAARWYEDRGYEILERHWRRREGEVDLIARLDRTVVFSTVLPGGVPTDDRPGVDAEAVVRRQGTGVRETFTVRKVSFGVGVERTFPVHSPVIDHTEVVSLGDVRRAKLYYLRDRHGKAAKIKELRSARP